MSSRPSESHQMLMLQDSLPEVIVRDGFRAVQIRRAGRFAIYRRECVKVASVHFEVVEILVDNKTRKLPSGSIRNAGHESYPSSSTWGTYGWTFSSLERAQDKLAQLRQMEDAQ